MAKRLREHLPGVPVHITTRGVGGRDIFLSDGLRRRFLADLLALQKALPFVIHAYCLMTNHIHLLLEAVDHELSQVMKLLLGQHAFRVNKLLGRSGHLYERRFDDVPCHTEEHYRNAAAYIHNNPVRAGLVKDASEWAWSSHRELLGEADNSFIPRQTVLETFGGLSAYRDFAGRQDPKVVARIANESMSREFDLQAFRDLTGMELGAFLESLARDAAKRTGLRLEDVIGTSRQRRESLARKLFIASARSAGVPVKQVARYLGRSASAVSEAVSEPSV